MNRSSTIVNFIDDKAEVKEQMSAALKMPASAFRFCPSTSNKKNMFGHKKFQFCIVKGLTVYLLSAVSLGCTNLAAK
jgi:hypothetical protein